MGGGAEGCVVWVIWAALFAGVCELRKGEIRSSKFESRSKSEIRKPKMDILLFPRASVVCIGSDEQTDAGDLAFGNAPAGFLAAETNQCSSLASVGTGEDPFFCDGGGFVCDHISCAAAGRGGCSGSKFSIAVKNGKCGNVVRSLSREINLPAQPGGGLSESGWLASGGRSIWG